MPIHVLEEDYLLTLPEESIEAAGLPEDITNAYYDPQGNFTAWCEHGKLTIRDQEMEPPTCLSSQTVSGWWSAPKNIMRLFGTARLFTYRISRTGKYSKPVFDSRWKNSPMLAAVFPKMKKS